MLCVYVQSKYKKKLENNKTGIECTAFSMVGIIKLVRATEPAVLTPQFDVLFHIRFCLLHVSRLFQVSSVFSFFYHRYGFSRYSRSSQLFGQLLSLAAFFLFFFQYFFSFFTS